jgi:SET family sugar efflux transporter-like MFS transporter
MIRIIALQEVFRAPGFWPMSLSVLVLGLAYSIVVPILSLYALTEVRMSTSQFGLYLACNAISGVIASMAMGKWSDSGIQRERLILLSLIAGIGGYLVFSQTKSFAVVMLTALVLGSLGGTAFSQMLALTRTRLESAQVKEMTLATSSVRMFFSLAWVLGPVLGALVLGTYHFQGVFLSTVALLLLVFAMVLWLPKVVAIGPDAAKAPVIRQRALWQHLRSKRIALSVLAFACLSLCSNLTMMTLPIFVTSTLHGEQSSLGQLLGLAAGLEIPLMLLTAFAADKVGKARLIVISALIYIVYFVVLANATAVWQLYPNQLLVAFAVSINMGIAISYFQDLLPGQPGVATGLFSSSFTVGGVMAGAVFAAVGTPFGYRGIFVACALFSALAAALMAAIPDSVHSASHDELFDR